MIVSDGIFKSKIANKKTVKKLDRNRKKMSKNPGWSYGIANAPMKTLKRKK